ncbi:hypothetical protein BD310DRAFT_959316 [Dichomitus squalens]|uniref:Uncharacterized protein n=1 Tax=Dichomitus squalens TaxID=114155 RepID=A0A4Q9PTP4_9APHY|nr:hypothetical protein BD310DRAFT_959316 [Dichomitus squalens]
MSCSSGSPRFAVLYDSLPTDVQSAIVQKQLIPLLDHASKARRNRVLSSAAKMHRRHARIPALDLRSKQREVNALLDDLHRDAKRSFVHDRSRRTELLEQTVESVTCWLNDIWRVVYEHNVDFMLAHRCLVFTMNTIDQIGHARASCRCALTSMYVPITIKRRSGKVVKSWEVNGAHNVGEVLEFIWRDLFLSMLATGTRRQIEKIPEMLDDIEDIMGWTSLERLLYGGRKCPHDEYGPDEEWSDVDSDIDEDEDAYTDDDSDLDGPVSDADWVPKLHRRTTPSHAKHWSHRISSQVWQFRKHVHAAMLAVFRSNPSLRLYSALLASSADPQTTQAELTAFLSESATSSPDVFAAALDIHALENNTSAIADLLATHAHLLRPRDAPTHQCAVTTLASDPAYHSRALAIIEKELLDTARTVRAALVSSVFSRLDTLANKTELDAIVKLRSNAAGRQDRVERWVDAVTTPGAVGPNPMALAALVMGIPLPVGPGGGPAALGFGGDGLDGDADPLGYLDLDPNDPDMEDLREEFRPRLKQRFEGWTDVAAAAGKSGAGVLARMYRELVRSMPFLRASDVVEEMLARVSEKPGKQHLIDAVDALSAFVKVQRRKLAASKSEQKRRANAASQTASSGSGPSLHLPLHPHPHPGMPMFMFGIAQTTPEESDTVPDRPETPPPPLEPISPAQANHEYAGPAAPAPLFTFYPGMPAPAPPPAVPTGGGGGDGGGYAGWNGMDDVD